MTFLFLSAGGEMGPLIVNVWEHTFTAEYVRSSLCPEIYLMSVKTKIFALFIQVQREEAMR